MARAWRKKNQKGRRLVALENLKKSTFTEKTLKNGHERTIEEWKERVAHDIEVLERRTSI